MSQNESMGRRTVLVFTNRDRAYRNLKDWADGIDHRAMQMADYAMFAPDLPPNPPYLIPIIKSRAGYSAESIAMYALRDAQFRLILSQIPKAKFVARADNTPCLLLTNKHELVMLRMFEYIRPSRVTLYE